MTAVKTRNKVIFQENTQVAIMKFYYILEETSSFAYGK